MRFGRKKVVITIIAILLVVAIGILLGQLEEANQAAKDAKFVAEQTAVVQSFAQQTGVIDPDAQIVKVTDGVYMASWVADNAVYAAWSIGGLWVQVYSQEIPAEESPEPVPEE